MAPFILMAMTDDQTPISTYRSDREASARARMRQLLDHSPIAGEELLANLGVYLNRQMLTRFLVMSEMYREVLTVPGVVMELGTRWGQNLSLFHSLRGIYEPYNRTRKIIGFDTFEGFLDVTDRDGSADVIQRGAYATTTGYEKHLQEVLECHEAESPLSHIRRFEIVKGDATETLPRYLTDHPETIVAFAYFDFDLYEPTKRCLEALRGHVTKGTVLGFDELVHPDFPGEVVALRETLGLDTYRLRRFPIDSLPSYLVIE